MPARRLKEFLDGHKVKYVTIRHSPAFTAQEIAASAHVPGKDLAKTVIVKIDDRMAMAVLPASDRMVLDFLKEATGARRVELATEQEFRDRFPECEVGAMPPFGNLYGMNVYVSRSLVEDDEIVFNAGNHTELFRMAYTDFERLADPRIMQLSYHDSVLV